MLNAATYERSRNSAWDGILDRGFADVDPTDDTGADVRNLAEPERRLFFTVLTDAIILCRAAARATRRTIEQLEAERWVRSDDRDWPCSFVNVCEALGIAAEPLRRAIYRWRRATDHPRVVTRRGLLVKKKRRAVRHSRAQSEQPADDLRVAGIVEAEPAGHD